MTVCEVVGAGARLRAYMARRLKRRTRYSGASFCATTADPLGPARSVEAIGGLEPVEHFSSFGRTLDVANLPRFFDSMSAHYGLCDHPSYWALRVTASHILARKEWISGADATAGAE